jgi:hypothetical protein
MTRNKHRRKTRFTLYINLACIASWGAPHVLWAFTPPAEVHTQGYVQNKGQIVDQFGEPNNKILYMLNGDGLNVHLNATGFSYEHRQLFIPEGARAVSALPAKIGALDNKMFRTHRIDIEFVDPNPEAELIASGPTTTIYNYFGAMGNRSSVTNVRAYDGVTYKNVQPGIDMVFKVDPTSKGPKYDIIVHPGADLSGLRFRVKGVEGIRVSGKSLWMHTSFGEYEETIPASFFIASGSRESVEMEWVVMEDGTVGLRTDALLSPSGTLVVDPCPVLSWLFQFGSSSTEWAKDMMVDADNNVIIAGKISTSNLGTGGPFDAVLTGTTDAYIAKVAADGSTTLICTYYGGNGDEYALGLDMDPDGHFVITGLTNSKTGINHEYSVSQTGTFLARFTPALDAIDWGRYCDGLVGMDVGADSDGNFVLLGYNNSGSISTGSLPAASGPGTILAKFSETGTLIWGLIVANFLNPWALDTYGADAIVVTGGTSSNGMSDDASTLHGGQDAYIATFDGDGGPVHATYLGGGGDEYGTCVRYDSQGEMGVLSSTSSNDVPQVGEGATPLVGSSSSLAQNGLIARYADDLALQWATYWSDVPDNQAWYCLEFDEDRNLISAGPDVASLTPTCDYGGTPNHYIIAYTPSGGAAMIASVPNRATQSLDVGANGRMVLAGFINSDARIVVYDPLEAPCTSTCDDNDPGTPYSMLLDDNTTCVAAECITLTMQYGADATDSEWEIVGTVEPSIGTATVTGVGTASDDGDEVAYHYLLPTGTGVPGTGMKVAFEFTVSSSTAMVGYKLEDETLRLIIDNWHDWTPVSGVSSVAQGDYHASQGQCYDDFALPLGDIDFIDGCGAQTCYTRCTGSTYSAVYPDTGHPSSVFQVTTTAATGVQSYQYMLFDPDGRRMAAKRNECHCSTSDHANCGAHLAGIEVIKTASPLTAYAPGYLTTGMVSQGMWLNARVRPLNSSNQPLRNYGEVCAVCFQTSSITCQLAHMPLQGTPTMIVDLPGLAIWPNPSAQGKVNIEANDLDEEVPTFELCVMDGLGRTIHSSREASDGAQSMTLNIDLGRIAPGLYYVTVTSGSRRMTGRWVVE